MITATLRTDSSTRTVTLTYDVAKLLRDDAALRRRFADMGVTVDLHFPNGDDALDNVPDLLRAAGDLVDQDTNDAIRTAQLGV